jgi:23S rRNA pseudouridine2605 synthase
MPPPPEHPDQRSTAPGGERAGERIAKLLARAGVASRREVERMIAEGRVKIGDQVVTTPATVLPNLNGVSVDGKPVKAPEAARLFAFHKPAGLITAERDPAGRPTIYTALRNALPPDAPRLMPVGRLDYNTEGLLLLTNDGELKRAMELPSSGIPRTYRARTFGEVSQAQLEALIEGIEIDGMRYGKIDANMERSAGRNKWIELTLTEGKNREVRRVLEHLGLEVSRLLRTSYGPFELLDLPRGAAVEIRQADVERFRKGLNTPGSADIAPRASHDQARARLQRSRPSARPAREPERPVSEPRSPAARKKPAPRKPDPNKLGLSTGRRGRSGADRSGPSGARPDGAGERRSGPRKPGAPKRGPRK